MTSGNLGEAQFTEKLSGSRFSVPKLEINGSTRICNRNLTRAIKMRAISIALLWLLSFAFASPPVLAISVTHSTVEERVGHI
jgi:hypothetical protein